MLSLSDFSFHRQKFESLDELLPFPHQFRMMGFFGESVAVNRVLVGEVTEVMET